MASRSRSLVSVLASIAGARKPIAKCCRSPASSRSTPTRCSNQAKPAIATDSQGNFVVVWEQHAIAMPRRTTSSVAASTARATGSATSSRSTCYTPGVQRRPRWRGAPAGGFVVIWASNGQDGDAYGVFGRRYDVSGNALAERVPDQHLHHLSADAPKAAMRSGGDFVVVWQSTNNQDGTAFGVFGRRFDSAGTGSERSSR